MFQQLLISSQLLISNFKLNLKVVNETINFYPPQLFKFSILPSKFISLTSTFLILISLLVNNGWGQTANQYTFATSTGASALTSSAWTTNTASSTNCDDGSFTGSLPFAFVYEGTSYTQFSYNFNGVFKFGPSSISNATSGLTSNGPIIAAGFNDVSSGYVTANIGYIRHGLTSAAAPNRVFVIDYYIRHNLDCAAAKSTSFQIRLYETTNVIEIAFLVKPGTSTWSTFSTVGLGGANSTNYYSVQTSDNTASTAAVATATTIPAAGRMYTFTPPACSVLTSPGTVSGNQTICSGGNPAAFTSSAAASGGSGGTITYQWQSATTNSDVSFSDIAGATAETYDPPSGLTTTTYYRRKARRCGGSMEVTSSVITVTVIKATRDAPTGQQCSGTTLNFSAAPAGGSYSWSVRTNGSSTYNSGSGFLVNTSASNTSGSASTFSSSLTNASGTATVFYIDVSMTVNSVNCTQVFNPTINPIDITNSCAYGIGDAGACATNAGGTSGNPFVPAYTNSNESMGPSWARDYIFVSVLNGATYNFSSSTAGDLIYVTSSDGGTIKGNGTTDYTYVSSATEIVRVYYHISTCAVDNIGRTRYVRSCGNPTPSAPNASAGSNASCTSISANWSASTNATSYRLDVSTVNTFASFVSGFQDLNVGNTSTYSVTGLTAGITYYYRVRAVNTCGTSGQSSTITYATSPATPAQPGTISGTASQCPSIMNQTYSVATVTNATTYTWTVPTGWSVTSGAGTSSITVTTGTSGQNGNISVTAGNTCGTSAARTLAVTVGNAAPSQPGTISGTVAQCPSIANQTYSVAAVTNATTYTWTVPAGWNITAGAGTNSITVTTGTAGQNGNISLTAGNTCGTSSAQILSVSVTALPTITASSGASRCGAGTLGISATASAGSIEWFNAASSGTSQGTSNSAATWTTPSILSTTTYYAEAVNGSCRSAARTAVTATVNTAAYRSFGTGNWSDATKWELSCDGTNWTEANVAPGSGDGAISIRNGHNMTITASTTLDELTIDAGATLTVNASQTLTIANGTGDDLTVNGSLVVNGSISNSGAIKLNSGGLYNHANGTSIPAGITFASGSTLEVSSSATCTNIHSYASRPHHLTWSSSGAMPTGMTSSGQFTMCNGNFTMSAGTFLVTENTSSFSSTNYDLTIGSNFYLNGGTIEITDNGGGANSSGKGKLIVSGDFVQTSGIFEFSNTGSNQVNTSNLEVFGNFTHTGGNFQVTNAPTNSVTITLSKTASNQTLESTGQTGSMIFNVAGSNAQCVVAASKTFVQSANTTFIVAAGTSTPDLLINGTFTRTGTSLTTTGTMSVASGGTYQHNCNGQSLPSATWDAASTCNITGTSSTTPTNFGQTFGNLTVNCSGTATTDANSSVAGNLAITGGTLTVGNNFTLGITGNSSITGTLSLGGTGAKTFTGNTTINSSGTLSVSGSGAYSMAGNFTNNGTFTPGTAILTLNGGGAQTLDGTSALSFSNVTIDKSGGTLTAQKDMTITGTLTLMNGILDMNSKTLTMGTASANGTITGGSASSYIVALDGGPPSKLIHRVNSTSNSTYSFPIGTGSKYTPVTVVMKGGTLSNASIQVWTKNSKVTGMSDAMSCHLNRSWFVEPTGITTPTYDIQLGFASGDFTGDAGFDLNPVKLSSGVWYKPSGSLLQNGTIQGTTIATNYVSPSTPATSSGTVYWNGLTSFSEFGGGGGSAPLPVELVSFSGSCENGSVYLSWQTASEFNTSHFDIEKSRDGENWQVIETIPAAGNSNELLNYEAFDQVTNILNYYRLNQVDIDGTNKRYDPIAVSCDEAQSSIFMTYPNPSANGFNVLVNDEDLSGVTTLNIYSASGSLAMTKIVELKEGINVFMIHDKLLPGLYFIELKDQNNKTKVIKHLIN